MKNLKCFALLFVFALTNCQSFNAIVQEPLLSFNSVEIAGINLTGVNLIAHVDVENPNSFSIPLPTIDWEVFINSASFVQGALKNSKSIKSRAKTTVDIPLSVTYEGLYNSVASMISTKEIDYDIALGISFPIPVIENKVYKLDFSGMLPLPQLPKLSPGEIKISKIDFSGVELSCGINVENTNVFAIPFPKLNWDYEVNSVPVLKSSFSGTGEIAAGVAALALLSLRVDYEDIFKAVSSARNSGEVKSNLALGINSKESGFTMPDADSLSDLLNIPVTIPILQMPEVSFAGIAKKSLGTTMVFTVNFEINNKNSFDVKIDEFNYDFSVNSNQWAKGSMGNPPNIKAGSKTTLPIEATISALSIVTELTNIISRGTAVNYNCTGNMAFDPDFSGIGKINVPLNIQGSSRIQ